MKGVVHVGSHRGEELEQYFSEGRSPIICFEPQELMAKDSRVHIVYMALGERSGRMKLRIPRHLHDPNELDTQSASGLMLIPDRARDIGWTPTECVVQGVHVIRFDEWAKLCRFESGSCSLLAIDVQGMELQVLRGAGEYLEGFDEIVAECSQPPIYEGGASTSEVAKFLKKYGFKQASPTVPHGDIKFIRSAK